MSGIQKPTTAPPVRRSSQGGVLRIIAGIGVIQVVAIAIGFARSKTIALLLGPAGVGMISVLDQAIQLVAQASAFGLPFASIKFLSRAHSAGFEEFESSYSSLLKLLVVLTGGGALIGVVLALWVPGVFDERLFGYRPLLVIGLAGVPAIALHGYFKNVLASARRVRVSALFDVVVAGASTLAICTGIALSGVQGYYVGGLVANLVIVVLALFYFRNRLGLRAFAPGGPGGLLRPMLKDPAIVTFSLILYATAFLQPLAFFVARYKVLAGFGEAEAGLLQAAIALSGTINLVLNPANGLYLTPILNSDIPQAQKLGAAVEFQSKLALAVFFVAMPMALFADLLLLLLFSPSFTTIAPVVYLFAIAQCVMQLGGVHQALIIGLDDIKLYGLNVAAGHLLLGVAAWFLVPSLGVTGVAVSLLLSNGTIFLLTLVQLRFRHGLVPPARLFWSMAYGFASLGVAGVLANRFAPWQPSVIAGKLALFVLFSSGLLLFLDRAELRELLRRGRAILPLGSAP